MLVQAGHRRLIARARKPDVTSTRPSEDLAPASTADSAVNKTALSRLNKVRQSANTVLSVTTKLIVTSMSF